MVLMVKREAGEVARKRFSVEERAKAVEIVRSSPHRTIKEIAFDLQINDKTLNEWVVKARRRRLDPDGSMSEAAKRRMEKLEAENALLRREIEFQKKARALISQMQANRTGSPSSDR